jgi:hypothetical protein
MLKYVFYPIFGLSVLGAYGATAATATDLTSVPTNRTTIPAQFRGPGAYRAAPIVWRTGFHGPAAYQPTYSSSGGGGGGFYGGFGGGK